MAELSINGNGNGRYFDLSRGAIPLLAALAASAAVAGIAYTTGGVMEGIRKDREATASRLSAIELAIADLKNTLAARGCVGNIRK
jgi:hypothetical protein